MEHPVTLRIDTGFKPLPDSSATLFLRFSECVDFAVGEVRCNGNILERIEDTSSIAIQNNEYENCDEYIFENIPVLFAYDIPGEYLKVGENVFELVSFSGDSELRYGEILIQPVPCFLT